MVRVNNKLIRKKLYLIIDTETFNGFDEPYCYDIGFAVIDKTGKVYAKYSFVVHETFIGMAEQAATAYYASKFPQYHADIREGKRQLVSIHTIIAIANALLEKWNIQDVVAHNAKFDCLMLVHFLNVMYNGGILGKWQKIQYVNKKIISVSVKKMDL